VIVRRSEGAWWSVNRAGLPSILPDRHDLYLDE
jgi:hypothetical protein